MKIAYESIKFSKGSLVIIQQANDIIDEYQAAEMPAWEWVSYAGACDECDAEDGPHDFGDEYPPAHPNCRCAVVTQLPDGTTTEEESMEE